MYAQIAAAVANQAPLQVPDAEQYDDIVLSALVQMQTQQLAVYRQTHWELQPMNLQFTAETEKTNWGYTSLTDTDGQTYLECYVHFVWLPTEPEVWAQHDISAGAWLFDSETAQIYVSLSFGLQQKTDGIWQVYGIGSGRPPAPSQYQN